MDMADPVVGTGYEVPRDPEATLALMMPVEDGRSSKDSDIGKEAAPPVIPNQIGQASYP